jgi:hypothetical protein
MKTSWIELLRFIKHETRKKTKKQNKKVASDVVPDLSVQPRSAKEYLTLRCSSNTQ